MTPALLDLLQLADSSFPSGSYAHSFGLEWIDRQGPLDLRGLLKVRLSQSLARLELPVLRHAYRASSAAQLQDLDRLMDVLTPVRELREASRSIGRSVLRAAVKLRGPLPSPSPAAAGEGVQLEHQPVVYGAVLRAWGIPLDDSLGMYALQAIRQQLSAAQRLGRIGQSAAQELLHALKPDVAAAVQTSLTVPLDEAGTFTPWLDMAGLQHAQQFARLFVS